MPRHCVRMSCKRSRARKHCPGCVFLFEASACWQSSLDINKSCIQGEANCCRSAQLSVGFNPALACLPCSLGLRTKALRPDDRSYLASFPGARALVFLPSAAHRSVCILWPQSERLGGVQRHCARKDERINQGRFWINDKDSKKVVCVEVQARQYLFTERGRACLEQERVANAQVVFWVGQQIPTEASAISVLCALGR